MEQTPALAEIARRVEGALERPGSRPVSPSNMGQSMVSSRHCREPAWRESTVAGVDDGGETTETDSESGDHVAYDEEEAPKALQRRTSAAAETTVTRPTRTATRRSASMDPDPWMPTGDLCAASPQPSTKKASGRPAPRLLTSRVAAAIVAREKPAHCDFCEQTFTPATGQSSSSQGTVGAVRQLRCACCKRQLSSSGFSTEAQHTNKNEIRCIDCEKAGTQALTRLRKAVAEKKHQANEKRRATMAKKKQQLQEQQEQDADGSDSPMSEPETMAAAKQRKRREQLSQRNFATFSRLILQDMGVDDVDVGGGLQRLRDDRAKRGGSLVGSKRRAAAPSEHSSDDGESDNEPGRRGKARGKLQRKDETELVPPRARPARKRTPKANIKTRARDESMEISSRREQRTFASPEVIEIDDSE